MKLDRPLLKARSKQIIRDSNPKVLTVSILFIALSALITVLSTRLVGINPDTAVRYLQYAQNGNYDAAISVIQANQPSAGAHLVNLLLEIVFIIVSLGFEIFLLNTLRGTAPVLGNLLDGFGYWWKILLIDLVCAVLIILWSLLAIVPGSIAVYGYFMARYGFITTQGFGVMDCVFFLLLSLLLVVPGVIAAYRYSMAHYVLITNPGFGVMECIRESKRLTKGWKGALFVMDLSFLGWNLLCAIPVLGWLLSVWVSPYRALSFLQAYEQISGYTVAEPAPENC